MGFFDRLRSGARDVGTAAKGAIDEGRVRIDIFRVRQQADSAAQALGYAMHRARREGRELDVETLGRLDAALSNHEAKAKQLELELARHRGETPPGRPDAEKSQPPEEPPAAAPAPK